MVAINDRLAGLDAVLVEQALGNEHVAVATILRDVHDVVNGGHWKPWGQKHHFMRVAGQNHQEAYLDGWKWILRSAEEASSEIHKRLSLKPGLVTSLRVGDRYVRGTAVQCLGNACHALQDSFSPSHVYRGPCPAYYISYIYVYEGVEQMGHDEHDDEWQDSKPKQLSPLGILAKDATKDLIWLTLQAAVTAFLDLGAGEQFRLRWLRPSPQLHLGIKPPHYAELEAAWKKQKEAEERAEQRRREWIERNHMKL
jgi:hypothetical protein